MHEGYRRRPKSAPMITHSGSGLGWCCIILDTYPMLAPDSLSSPSLHNTISPYMFHDSIEGKLTFGCSLKSSCCALQLALQQSAEAAAGVRAQDLAAAERLKREVAALRHETQTLAAQLQVARVRMPWSANLFALQPDLHHAGGASHGDTWRIVAPAKARLLCHTSPQRRCNCDVCCAVASGRGDGQGQGQPQRSAAGAGVCRQAVHIYDAFYEFTRHSVGHRRNAWAT